MRNERQRFSRVGGIPLLLVSAVLFIAPGRAPAFEADVHYGLTHWLALQAGFEPRLQAQIIATGDGRGRFGVTCPSIDLVAMYLHLHRGRDQRPSCPGSTITPPRARFRDLLKRGVWRPIAARQGRQRWRRSRLAQTKRNLGFRSLAKDYTCFRIRGRIKAFQVFRSSAISLPRATADWPGVTLRHAEVPGHTGPISLWTGQRTQSQWRMRHTTS